MSAVMRPRIVLDTLAEEDLPDVVRIERAIYPFPWTLGNFRDSIAAGYHCPALRLDGKLIGYAVMMFGPDEAHLLNLSVAEQQQRHGYGEFMLRQLLRVARERGAQRMFLEVRPSNAPALALYAKHGFAEIGRRRDYYPAHGGREDAIVLSLDV